MMRDLYFKEKIFVLKKKLEKIDLKALIYID